ncbi:beta-ketoacyl-[acyl-carrier-protein] synthase family protein [Paenibacillus aestuarii]|uniref:Beta-ketoacyl-[acyl-carrier-protein] synthase family protein n=1 Tax=Paenibacillus aestuarii TaxID=516965 RepID=A0ABW0K5L0_9BACL|nr:beta-ketoacyl synthase N-terminal-like domain-containing protein [Paenibacillus aestuarii]
MIVVTGYGMKGPMIDNTKQFQQILENGTCTLNICQKIGPNETDILCGQIAHTKHRIDGKNYRSYPKVARLALLAAVEAVEMAGLREKMQGRRVAVIIGTSTGGLIDIEKGAAFSSAGNSSQFPPLSAGLSNFHSGASAITAHFGLNGLTLTLTNGCTASTDAIVMGKLLLETGQADICMVGGAEAPITPFAIYSFYKGNDMNGTAEAFGRPFQEDCDGFVFSEGAGVLILEREADALQREIAVQGIVAKGSSNNDGLSIYKSDLSGTWMIEAMRELMEGQMPTYVNSQALGLDSNDNVEKEVHRQLFDASVPITSIKGMIGHPFGAAGAMQAISALISIRDGFIPPTTRSNGCGFEDLPIVFETMRRHVQSVAITSHGFGGNNSCLLISKY